MGFDYDVFFSYRHKPLDNEITRKTFNALESYRLPPALRRQGFADIRRAFRDTEELPVSRILTDTIDRALRSTNCLVVVCSTDTPASEWIDREVATFIELGRADHIYPLLITGDPERSFPPSLKLVPDILDRVMDIRTEGNPVKKMMAKAETELLRVVAGITGCRESELLREHKLRRSRRFAARTAGAAAALLTVAGVSLGLMGLARSYRDTAALREEASMRILSELTYSLPDHLTNVPGAYPRIAGILRANTEDINAILRLSRNRDAAEYEAAANYEKLASAGVVLGQYSEALDSEEEALGRYQLLAENGYDGGTEALASAYNNRGRLFNAVGRYTDAAADFEQGMTLLRGTSSPDALTLARMAYNAGANAVDAGDHTEAAAFFEESLSLLRTLPESGDVLEAAAGANYNYGVLLYRSGQYGEARARLEESCDLYARLRELVDSLQNRIGHVQAASALAVCLTDEGRFQEADLFYELAIGAAEELAADEENTEALLRLAELTNNRGILLNIQGDYAAADKLYEQASLLYRQVSERTGASTDAAVYAISLLNLGENAFKAGDYARSREKFEEGLALYGSVCSSLGSYDSAQYYAWLCYYELIHLRDPESALEAGLTAYQLQPDHVLVNLNLAYACLYSGHYEDADALFGLVASLGEGQVETIRRDLEAQQAAGLRSEHMDAVWRMLDS